ncbi:MAG: histidine--tRNA ligase [Candidatus Aramenus sp.]|jgi:histidyl-tRNA synthetase|nr:histidine--tRNA ligase [Candidatus Aramenus sp.]
MVSTEPPRGMRDLVFEEAQKIRYIEQLFRTHVELAGYNEAITPIVEEFELFSLKGGEEIRNTMYVFLDKAGRELALRPEITPSIVRLYLNSMQHIPKPVRLYYIGRVYRYDEPQQGRYREFRQAGIELLGSDSLYSDVEVLDLLYNFYKKLGIADEISIKINNIGIYRLLFRKYGIEDNLQEHLLHLIDKGKKDEALQILQDHVKDSAGIDFATKLIRSEVKMENVDGLISSVSIKGLAEEVERIRKIVQVLGSLGVRLSVDLSFVRGLAYYTGVIFEVIHPKVNFSIAGGGRYDGLVEVYGGPRTPAIGFALGIERTSAVLDYERKSQPQVVVIALDDSVIDYALVITNLLREKGISTLFNVKEQQLGKLLMAYYEQNVKVALIIGTNEKSSQKVTIRDLSSRKQEVVGIGEILDRLRQIL